jgi:hypothetical protein
MLFKYARLRLRKISGKEFGGNMGSLSHLNTPVGGDRWKLSGEIMTAPEFPHPKFLSATNSC